METDTALKKGDITDMVSQIEAVKREANTESNGKNQNWFKQNLYSQ